MSLLKWLQNVSPFRGMPVDDKSNTSSLTSVTGETVSLYYYNSGTLTADAGQAAGTVVIGVLAYDNVKIPEGTLEATGINSSLSFTSTALTTEVAMGVITPEFVESLDESKGSVRAAAIGAKLANGEYYVDYATGTIYGKKASTQTSLTSTAYKVRQQTSSTTIAANSSVNVNQIAGTTTAVNTGNASNGTQRVVLATDQPAVTVSPNPATPSATSTYAASMFANLGADATLNVKASAGNVLGVHCANTNAATRYLQIHNTATVPSPGGTALYSVQVPTGSTTIIGTEFFGEGGLHCSTGIAFAFSTTDETYTAGTNTDQTTYIRYK